MGLFAGLSLLLTSQASSAWQLFTNYSLLMSVGTTAVSVVALSTVSRWFDRRRGLVMGIISAGAGLGRVVMPPFAVYLISDFGWRMAYIVMGLIALIIVLPLSRLLRKEPGEIGALPDGAKPGSRHIVEPRHQNGADNIQLAGLSLPQVFKSGNFWLLMFIWLLIGSTMNLVSTHIVPHATDTGISAQGAAVILSLSGGAHIAGSLLMGAVSDRIGRKTVAIICSLLLAGATLWLIWAQELWMLYLFALVFGFSVGGMLTSITALVSDTFGLRRIGTIFGLLDIGGGIGAAIGPVIGGFIFDVNGSYSVAFLIGAVTLVVMTLLIAQIRRETSSGIKKPDTIYTD
jgi:MFS family permease